MDTKLTLIKDVSTVHKMHLLLQLLSTKCEKRQEKESTGSSFQVSIQVSSEFRVFIPDIGREFVFLDARVCYVPCFLSAIPERTVRVTEVGDAGGCAGDCEADLSGAGAIRGALARVLTG